VVYAPPGLAIAILQARVEEAPLPDLTAGQGRHIFSGDVKDQLESQVFGNYQVFLYNTVRRGRGYVCQHLYGRICGIFPGLDHGV